MPFSRLAENRINEAVARGEFDNLPNAGQPLDLESYFATPAELRMAYSILKNANCAPIEVELLKEIARLKDAIAAAGNEADKKRLQQTLNDRQLQLTIKLERRAKGEK